MNKEFKIFIDFDGTITKQDVGEAVFRKFGEVEKVNSIIKDLLIDKISAKNCWILLCETIEKIDKAELNDFIDSLELDESFPRFVNYCRENDFDFYVLSDGFDYYIERIFSKHKLGNIKYYSNRLKITSDGKLVPSFPYTDHSCLSSANCKRNHIINHSADEDYTVFIGDGNSDKYTVQFCDFIFAKDDLLKFCEVERITYFPFSNFDDVMSRLDSLKIKKRLKKRYQAELKRKEVYIRE